MIQTFLEINSDLILFVYGLVFFVLGLAIAIQSRRFSRLDLARSLKWLAAFGITHGFHEWGDLFIPAQAIYMSASAVQFLSAIQLVILAISFAFLFEFGVALLSPLHKVRWLHWVSAGLFLVWVFIVFVILRPFVTDLPAWFNTANALARYFIGFPGGVLAAYGLRHQALQRIASLNIPGIVRTLRIAGVFFILYAVFGGLIPPPVSFFPGNLLNVDTFTQVIGFPPWVCRSLIGLVLAITIIRAMEVFDVETARMIEAMEQQQILNAERERIARELHDGTIQMVYTAGLLVESTSRLVNPDSQVAVRLNKAITVLNDAIHELRRSLGELRATPTSELLSAVLYSFADDPRFGSLVDVSIDIDQSVSGALSPVRTDHLIAIVTEALSNTVRHARAQRVKITGWHTDGRLNLTIQDDGVGLPRKFEASYGLRNMRDRARLLGGLLDISSAVGKGTTVTLDIPWTDER